MWDLSSPGYQRSSEKIVEWERVGNLFSITGIEWCILVNSIEPQNITNCLFLGAQASQKWVSLREKYRREKHKLSNEEELKGTKRWVLFNHLKFLDDGPPQSKMIKLYVNRKSRWNRHFTFEKKIEYLQGRGFDRKTTIES